MFLRFLYLLLSSIRCSPHLILFYFHRRKDIIHSDVRRWMDIMRNYKKGPPNIALKLPSFGFLYLLSYCPEYRNLFYARLGNIKHFLNLICPKVSTLRIDTEDIGEGLFIQHGFATAIGARSIGRNCFINQQVTITGHVIVMDNVRIHSGAIIIGRIRIGIGIARNAVIQMASPLTQRK